MRISNLQYVHLFINDKEYILSVTSVLTVEDYIDTIQINLKKENDKSVEDLSAFFHSLLGEEILIFVGFYNKETFENEVISATTSFAISDITPKSLVLKFIKVGK